MVMRLHDLYQKLSTTQRQALAKKAGVDAGYLWQIATRWRGRKPSLVLVQRLAVADRRLTVADLLAEFSEPVASPVTKETAHA